MDAFIEALRRNQQQKAEFYQNRENSLHSPFWWLSWITEETGEVATALMRGRKHAAIAECVDVALAALRLASALDTDGTVLSDLFTDDWRNSATDHWKETHGEDPPWEH